MTDKEETTKPEDTDEDVSMISKAEKAAERLEKAAERYEKLVARQIVSGHADAGKPPAEPKEETPAEYSKRIMSGEVNETKE